MLRVANILNSGVCSKVMVNCKAIAVNYQNEKEIKICVNGRGKSS